MKKFIVSIGRSIMDFVSISEMIIILSVFLYSLWYICTDGNGAQYIDDEQKINYILILITVCFILFLASIISKYVIYLLIDIRDNLEKLNNNFSENTNDSKNKE